MAAAELLLSLPLNPGQRIRILAFAQKHKTYFEIDTAENLEKNTPCGLHQILKRVASVSL